MAAPWRQTEDSRQRPLPSTRTIAAFLQLGPLPAWLSLRLNLTYRREGIVGWNPARQEPKEPASVRVTEEPARRDAAAASS